MWKLSDPNPYEILGVSVNADKSAISSAYSAALRNTHLHKRQVQDAFHSLIRPESRLLVDAFTLQDNPEDNALEAICQILNGEAQEIDWNNFLDYEAVLYQDLKSLTEKIVRSLFEEVAAPKSKPSLSNNFDGLNTFIEEWLE